MATETETIEIIMATSNATFLSNLFDPGLVDPSFTESNPMVIKNRDIEQNFNEENTTSKDGTQPSDNEFQQDIYFVLVIATCSLTVLIAISLALYRMIDILLSSSGESGPRAENRHPGSHASPTSTNQQDQSGGSISNFMSGFLSLGSTLERRATCSSSSATAGPGSTTPSFFSFRGKRGDNPPPYDDPPAYHIAISMGPELDLSQDDQSNKEEETSSVKSENDITGASQNVSDEGVKNNQSPRNGVASFNDNPVVLRV